MPRLISALALALTLGSCTTHHEPAAHDATAVRELGCLVVTTSVDAVPQAQDAILARLRLDNRCARAVDVDLGSVVARGRDTHTHEARMRRLGGRPDDHFPLAASVTTERTLRFDAAAGARPAAVCLDLGPAIADDAPLPAACFARRGDHFEVEPLAIYPSSRRPSAGRSHAA